MNPPRAPLPHAKSVRITLKIYYTKSQVQLQKQLRPFLFLVCSSLCGLSHAHSWRTGCGLCRMCNHPVVEGIIVINMLLIFATLLVKSPCVLLTSLPSLFLVRHVQVVTIGRFSGQAMSRFKALQLPSLAQDRCSWARTELTPAWRLKLGNTGSEIIQVFFKV